MAINDEILKRIKETAGLSMTTSSDFEALSQAVKDKTGESLGVNTLKRIFGYKTQKVEPRQSTKDILARFLGKSSYASFVKELGNEADISMFTPVNGIEVRELTPGAKIKLTYDPDREFMLTYLGDCNFIVNEVRGSHNIKEGDVMTITQIIKGHRFVASHVIRNNEDLGGYESAKDNGVRSVEVTS